ncbi:MAG: DNA-directed RNA polymerase subunit beta, partial [Acidobacteria bacterium]|nr:DNA-directed RNA polymerase subunit beta [Acidobacteriota bacterium]
MLTAEITPKKTRHDFSRIRASIPLPKLIEVQHRSYDRFLQKDLQPQDREEIGLQAVFRSIFPIKDFRDNCELDFLEYSVGRWACSCGELEGIEHTRNGSVCNYCGDRVHLKVEHDVEQCRQRGKTYAVPLKVKIRLTVWDRDPETNQRSIHDIKEEEVFFGDIPLMTENGTFIINGTERVVVSQLHRSPGVFFHEAERGCFLAQVVPYRGSWLEFETDARGLLQVRIDRKKRFPATIFLRALGFGKTESILARFFHAHDATLAGDRVRLPLTETLKDMLLDERIERDIEADGEVVIEGGKRISRGDIRKLTRQGREALDFHLEALGGFRLAVAVTIPETGEEVPANTRLTPELVDELGEVGTIRVVLPGADPVGTVLADTLDKDPLTRQRGTDAPNAESVDGALVELYRRQRPGDQPTVESSRTLLHNLFFNEQKYDFSRVGRRKLATKLEREMDPNRTILAEEDFVLVLDYLLRLTRGESGYRADDIDHLGNRRVRSVGELLENQFRLGLVRMERAIREKMNVYQEMTTAMPRDLINAKPVTAAVREFFGASQLSQFMEQTNPLSEVTHKRRLSALGPGGLSRDRAKFDVRDVHATHYGRICPIETPEGPNIG